MTNGANNNIIDNTMVVEDIIRRAFSLEGGCADLLYEGIITDIRNTDNAWVEGGVYLFNLDAFSKTLFELATRQL